MRIYLKLSPNTEVVPFNYQGHLVQKLHEWIGKNNVHDGISLYSFSWLTKGRKVNNGLNFQNGSDWFISAYDDKIIKSIIHKIQESSTLAFGMVVQEVSIFNAPSFSSKEKFRVASPVFIKRNVEGKQKFYYHSDQISPKLLTETLQTKLEKAQLSTEVQVRFDSTYPHPRIKGAYYKKHLKKASVCPVILEGNAEAIRFAWDVGIGSNTGMGFGALI